VTQCLLALLKHSPELYLDELVFKLDALWGIRVSLATVWRTLNRLGIRHKKVCPSFSPPDTVIDNQVAVEGSC
jgi:transposase